MYLNMLRRDLKDQKALNVVLFAFMIVATVAMVAGATLLYSFMVGEQMTYEKCNSTDLIVLMPVDQSDAEGARQEVFDAFGSLDIARDMYVSQVVAMSDRTVFVNDEEGESVEAIDGIYIITSKPQERNIPYTLNGEDFEVPNGCVAVSQLMARRMGIGVGDKLRLVSQMGNVYEFTICEIYRNPIELTWRFLYLSDRDAETFYAECPKKTDFFELNVDAGDGDYVDTLLPIITDTSLQFEDRGIRTGAVKVASMNDTGIMVLIIVLSTLIVALFVMAMIMMTIDFSIKSMVKREAKQIGMMKAIGVWSFSYKLLYVVKYMAFCVVCGLIGLPLGFMLSEKIYDVFVYDVIFPDKVTMIMIGVSAMLVNIAFILFFCVLSLRRMNKISVIDAIHGENRGERFTKLPGLSLVKSKTMGVSSFLAVSDILRALKRYIYLILAYTLGIAAVLFMIQLKDSVLDVSYLQHYFQRGRIDFDLKLEDSYVEKLAQRAGSYSGVYDILNDILEENDIPARLVLTEMCTADIYHDDVGLVAEMAWQDADISGLYYLPGGDAPVLYNEVAISKYHADMLGVGIGDYVMLEYDRFSEDHTHTERVTEDFMITGFIDYHGTDLVKVIMSPEFEGAMFTPDYVYSAVIDAPLSEHEAIRNQMQAIWTNGEVKVLSPDDVVNDFLEGYDLIFNMMIAATAFAAAGVLILLTCLYENIFIEEETADIALLKSMGFKRSVIRGWHLIRLTILGVLSMGLSLVFTATLGNKFAETLFVSLLRNYSFKLTVDPIHNFVIVPLIVISGLVIVVYLMTRLTDRIQIWKVRTE